MVDVKTPSPNRPAIKLRSEPLPSRKSVKSSQPVLLLSGGGVLLGALGVATFMWWDAVSAAVVQMWESLRFTWPALVVWLAAFAVAFARRRNAVKRHPHRWAAGLVLVAVVAGCLQLSGQGLGGEFGGWIIGSSAAWGIVRTAVIFSAALAIALPAPALVVGRLLLIGLGFAAVYFWAAAGHFLRFAQAAGVWIGLRCTEVSPGIARAVAAAWRGVCAVYAKAPVHLYLLASLVIIGALVFRRPARTRRQAQPVVSPYEAYLYPRSARNNVYAQDAFKDTGAPWETPATPAPSRPMREPDLGPESPPIPAPTHVSETPAHAVFDAPPAGDVEDETGDDTALDVMSECPEAIEEMDEVEAARGAEDFAAAPFASDEEEEEEEPEDDSIYDELDILAGPEVIDLSSDTARTSGRIASGKGTWKLPPLDILKSLPHKDVSDEVHQATARLIEETLAEYNIEVNVKEIRPGPVVTQYGIVPGWVRRYKNVRERNPDGTPASGPDGKALIHRVEEKTRVRVDHVLAREKDLALALAAPSLRFEAPVPGESFMGLEVPNAQRDVVTLRSSLESSAFQAIQKKAKLPVALGLGSGGEPVIMDLADMPHLLIAGSTGSGKSVCMNTIICSLMMQCTPQDLQMYLVDPKRVELTAYNGLPHLAGPVLVEVDQAVPALHALIAEMQSRYKQFERRGARNIATYNGKLAKGEERMPYLILVIDELADLMMTASGDVEHALCRLAQLGRATGIHLVVATQRPSVDVLTGLIKANFPSRMSFAVSSQVDSRTVLDSVGAEKLLGRGDLLFLPTNAVKPKRLQGAFISDEEVDAIVSFWQTQRGGPRPVIQMEVASPENEEDTMLQEAQRLAINHSRISASLLQRKLGVGYAKAASLLDHLEDRGIVGPGDPGKSREVITPGG